MQSIETRLQNLEEQVSIIRYEVMESLNTTLCLVDALLELEKMHGIGKQGDLNREAGERSRTEADNEGSVLHVQPRNTV